MRPETETLENALPDWQCITHVLLDLDGTLLDKDFDDHLWQELVPMAYARENGISLQEAKTILYAAYMKEWGRLNWNDIDRWSALFGLEIVALQRSVASKVAMHPGVREFLEFVRAMGQTVAPGNERPPQNPLDKNGTNSIERSFRRGSERVRGGLRQRGDRILGRGPTPIGFRPRNHRAGR